MIKAITFDLWDTLIHDDSDEPKRAARGLRSKKAERRHLVWEALNAEQPIDLAAVTLAYDTADAGFNVTWRELHINWRIEQRLRVVLTGLGRRLSPAAFETLLRKTAEMEVEIPPDPIEGAEAALQELARRYKLCIVSDAIVTPGTGLRRLLELYGMKQYFAGFAFSDEVGHSKPHRSMFESAAAQLAVEFGEMLHIGARDQTAVRAPRPPGMRAVFSTATRDLDKANTTADAICERHRDLPAIVDRLAAH